MFSDDLHMAGHSSRLRLIHFTGANTRKVHVGQEHVSSSNVELWEAETEALRLPYLMSGNTGMLRLWQALANLLKSHGKGSWHLVMPDVRASWRTQQLQRGASDPSDCQRLRERLRETKHEGTFADAAAVFNNLQEQCVLKQRLVPLVLWSNKACMTGNHLLSLVSSASDLHIVVARCAVDAAALLVQPSFRLCSPCCWAADFCFVLRTGCPEGNLQAPATLQPRSWTLRLMTTCSSSSNKMHLKTRQLYCRKAQIVWGHRPAQIKPKET